MASDEKTPGDHTHPTHPAFSRIAWDDKLNASMAKQHGGDIKCDCQLVALTNLEDASEATYEGGLHPLCTEEEAVGRHRAHVVADLAPTDAEAEKNESGGPGLVADEMSWAVSFSAQSKFSSRLRRQKSRDRRELPAARSIRRGDLSRPRGPLWHEWREAKAWPRCTRTLKGSGGGLCRPCQPSWLCKRRTWSRGQPLGSAADDLARWVQKVSLLDSFSAGDVDKTKLSFVQHKTLHLAKPGATGRTFRRKHDLSIWFMARWVQMVSIFQCRMTAR